MSSRRWKLPFFTIWAGQALSLVGSHLVQFALIWWLTETTGSAKTLATATAISFLPTIFLGPFAGTLVDRWPRKWVLILSDGSTALFTALLSVLFWLDIAQPWHVFVILFLRSLGDCFQNPAMMSTTPLMVPKDQLTRVAAMNSTMLGISRFLAPPLGALLLALVDVRGILPLDMVTAVLAIAPLFLIRVPQPAAEMVRGTGLRPVIQGLGEGLTYVWNWRGLRVMMASAALWALIAQPVGAFLPLLVAGHFRGGALELGWIQSAQGISMIVGGVLLSTWGGFRRSMATNLTGTTIVILAFLITALASANALWLAIVSYGLLGVGFAAHVAGLRAMQQAVVAPEMQGRYFALERSVVVAMAPIALAIAGPLADIFGVRPVWFVATAGVLVIALIRRFTRDVYYIEDQPAVERSA